MACFTVPAAEAVITSAAKKVLKNSKKDKENIFIKRIGWLSNMLWGGSALLCFEHIWHGEITPWFPFLTSAANPQDLSAMLFEMATSGVGMAVLVTAVWVGMVCVAGAIEKREATPEEEI